jgi:hypothetical protein
VSGAGRASFTPAAGSLLPRSLLDAATADWAAGRGHAAHFVGLH